MLLSGPAGFGKTTLAHVVARQAGYDVMEINARYVLSSVPVHETIPHIFNSDSRSGQVIDDRIRPTLESGSAVGSKKPVCVVIDEIDGATGAGDNVGFSLLCFGRWDPKQFSRRRLSYISLFR